MNGTLRRMAAAATELAEQGRTLAGQRAAHILSGQPALVLRRLHDDDASVHAGMVGAAELRAQEVECAFPLGPEPEGLVAAGHHVVLRTERGHEEAVDHVLR